MVIINLDIDFLNQKGSLTIGGNEVPVIFDHQDLVSTQMVALRYQRIYAESDRRLADFILEALYALLERPAQKEILCLCVYGYRKIINNSDPYKELHSYSVDFDVFEAP